MNSSSPLSVAEARYLGEWLDDHPSEEWCYRVLRVMAHAHRDALAAGREPPTLLAKEIAEKLGESMPDPKRPGEWMDWKRLMTYWSASIETDLLLYLRDREQSTYLKPTKVVANPDSSGKGRGGRHKQSTYRLASVPLPPSEIEIEPDPPSELTAPQLNAYDAHIVHYVRQVDVMPALWARLFFTHNAIRFTWGRGWLLISYVVAAVLLAVTVSLLGYVALTATTLSPRQLVRFAALVAVIDLAAWWALRPWWRLMDDRLVPAPDVFVPLQARSAQLELMTDGQARWVELVRYTAACPVCGATLQLEDGAPDYVRRMVGRCRNSPREHVFSFDRVTRRGRALRAPPEF